MDDAALLMVATITVTEKKERKRDSPSTRHTAHWVVTVLQGADNKPPVWASAAAQRRPLAVPPSELVALGDTPQSHRHFIHCTQVLSGAQAQESLDLMEKIRDAENI